MNWKFFIGSSILAAGLLLKVGAPPVAIALGIAAAAFLNWWKHHGSSVAATKKQTGA